MQLLPKIPSLPPADGAPLSGDPLQGPTFVVGFAQGALVGCIPELDRGGFVDHGRRVESLVPGDAFAQGAFVLSC